MKALSRAILFCLDHEKLGYQLTVVTEITVSKGRLVETENEIAKIPNVCSVYDVTGLTDAIIVAKFKSREDLGHFTKKTAISAVH